MERKLVVPGRYDRLEQIAGFVEQCAQDAGLDELATCRCQLAVDEACTNVIEHGYQGENRGKIEIACRPGDGVLTITIRDQAPPFDLDSVPPPDLSASLEDLEVGGLGVYFIRQVMDDVRFTHENGHNKLVMVKRREPPGGRC